MTTMALVVRPPVHCTREVAGMALRAAHPGGCAEAERVCTGENPVTSQVAKTPPECSLWLDQLSLGISRKRMSVLAMVP